MVVGLQNTLRVAVAGIVLATVLGTIDRHRPAEPQLDRPQRWRRSTSRSSATSRCCCSSSSVFLAIVLGVFPGITDDSWEPLGPLAVISNRGIRVPGSRARQLEARRSSVLAAVVAGCGSSPAGAARVADRTGRRRGRRCGRSRRVRRARASPDGCSAASARRARSSTAAGSTGGITIDAVVLRRCCSPWSSTRRATSPRSCGARSRRCRGARARPPTPSPSAGFQRLWYVVLPAGVPHRHPADRQPVPQPDQELVARRGDRLLRAHHGHADGRRQRRAGGAGVRAR